VKATYIFREETGTFRHRRSGNKKVCAGQAGNEEAREYPGSRGCSHLESPSYRMERDVGFGQIDAENVSSSPASATW
jgi:hypothetical protein